MSILKYSLAAVLFSIYFAGFGQIGWTWTPLADMPFAVSNNAVTHAEVGGNMFIYSFGGIDTLKTYAGITDRSFKYDVTNDTWTEIDPLPVTLPLIASSANTVKNKIYIIGGYHVYSNGNETSSDEVIIYDPVTDSYETNGAAIPYDIDDQSQVVYKDSLIYVITGWSNFTNIETVQIYDPALDQWQQGTPVPNSQDYKVFGSSAQIIGDTIYYYGGASTASNFPATNKLRKGLIDPADPTQISWTIENDAPVANYRSACVSYGNRVFWIGGSETSYNYNGIAYNGTGGVPPTSAIASYNVQNQSWENLTGSPYPVMDLRGYGQISSTEWIIAGSMNNDQDVTPRTFKLSLDPIASMDEQNSPVEFHIVQGQLLFSEQVQEATIYSLDGKLIHQMLDQNLPNLTGIFLLEYRYLDRYYTEKILLE